VTCSAGVQQLKLVQVVRDDVEQVLVSTTSERRSSSFNQLVVRDGDVVSVDCVAAGACPPPSVVIRLGQRDVSDLFSTSVRRSLSGQLRGMRRVQYRVFKHRRKVGGLRASITYDGLALRCLATVPGFAPLSVALQLIVFCNHS